MVCGEKIFETSKHDVSGKIFLLCPKKIFETTSRKSPGRQLFREKFLDALFYSESAPQSLAPQLLEASYAPAPMPNIAYTKKNYQELFLNI